MKESSRRDNKYRSGSTLCRGSKERHTRWQINTPFPVASRGALNSNVRRMTPRSVCALNAPPTRFACSHYVGARWSEQYTWDCFALTSLHLLVSHMGHEMGLQVSWLWGLRELLHLWSGNWNDKDLKFLIWIGLKKKKEKKNGQIFPIIFLFIDSNRSRYPPFFSRIMMLYTYYIFLPRTWHLLLPGKISSTRCRGTVQGDQRRRRCKSSQCTIHRV